MRRKILSILLLIFFLIFPIILTFNTYIIKFHPLKYNKLSIDTFTQLKSSQTNVVWERVYGKHFAGSERNDAIWSDGTYIYTCGTYWSTSNDCDLLLTKWDSNGDVIWNKSYAGDGGGSVEKGTDVWGNGTYIYTCGLTNKDGNYDMLINKWYPNGTIIWSNSWGGLGDDASYCIWGDPEGVAVFTCGYITTASGDTDASLVIWETDTGDYSLDLTSENILYDDVCFSITSNDGYLYLCGRNGTGSGNSDLFLTKFGFPDYWTTSWKGDDDDGGVEIWLDGNDIYTCGFTESKGSGGKDLLLVKWRDEGDWVRELWNRTYGDEQDDEAYSLWGYGNYIYTIGYTESYDDDLLLLKWDKHGNLIWNSTWGDSEYPDAPAYGTDLIGDANYVYTCGWVDIEFSMLWGRRRALIKWDANPEQLNIDLVSPAENSCYEGEIEIDIDLNSEFVFLDTVLYKWDGVPDTVWSEPYTTNLPLDQGPHTLYVEATTSTPYISDSDSFTFIRDDNDPIVKIEKPETNEVWEDAPGYDVEITEPNIDEIWYTLNDGSNHYIDSGVGEIDQSAWNSLSDGDVTIKFYVSDILGHLGYDQVVVQKDTKAEQREMMIIIRNAIITASITGVVGIAFFLIKRKIGKKKDKALTR